MNILMALNVVLFIVLMGLIIWNLIDNHRWRKMTQAHYYGTQEFMRWLAGNLGKVADFKKEGNVIHVEFRKRE